MKVIWTEKYRTGIAELQVRWRLPDIDFGLK